MPDSSDPDLIKITEIFLVPSSFLVAALGTADTNAHRACVSLLGMIVAGLWWICSNEALAERRPPEAGDHPVTHPRRVRIMAWLAPFFTLAWAGSLVVHLWLWSKPLGTG